MNTLARRFILPALLPILLCSGCGDESPPPSSPPSSQDAAAPASSAAPTEGQSTSPGTNPAGERSDPARPGEAVEIAGLAWAVPADWESVPATGMRLAEYKVTDPAGGAVASIRFFSTQGSAQMNIERWKGQVREPIAGPDEKTIEAGSLTVSLVAITGTYSGMGPTGAQTPGQSGTRLLAAYIDGGPRPVQVLVSGSDELVRGIEPAWEAMLASARVR